MTTSSHRRADAGLIVYASLCLLSSWLVAAVWAMFSRGAALSTVGTKLFSALVVYALTMGWQPLAATWIARRWVDPIDVVDLGLRPARSRDSLAAGASAVAIVGAASLVALGLVGLGWSRPLTASPPERGVVIDDVVVLLVASCGTALLGSFQSVTEELGWRGYFLRRATERFGRWRGLVLQGALWGVWYAPVIFFASFEHWGVRSAIVRGAVCVLTSTMLGVLLGALALASRSLTPVIVANTTITFVAGFPYVFVGIDAGLRTAVFGPAGWIVLGALLFGLSRCCPLLFAREAPSERSRVPSRGLS